MTDINGNHTVKNVTATTFELFEVATATNSTPEPLDGTGFSAWTSGGTAVHTTIVLNDIQGEFAAGETITAPTNSRTGTVQFNAFGCKGFEQKEFGQTKGISMAGSPTYTANVSLDSTFGDVKNYQEQFQLLVLLNHKVVLLWTDQTPTVLIQVTQ